MFYFVVITLQFHADDISIETRTPIEEGCSSKMREVSVWEDKQKHILINQESGSREKWEFQ